MTGASLGEVALAGRAGFGARRMGDGILQDFWGLRPPRRDEKEWGWSWMDRNEDVWGGGVLS